MQKHSSQEGYGRHQKAQKHWIFKYVSISYLYYKDKMSEKCSELRRSKTKSLLTVRGSEKSFVQEIQMKRGIWNPACEKNWNTPIQNKCFLSGETDRVRDSTAEIRGTGSIQITGVTDEICIQWVIRLCKKEHKCQNPCICIPTLHTLVPFHCNY